MNFVFEINLFSILMLKAYYLHMYICTSKGKKTRFIFMLLFQNILLSLSTVFLHFLYFLLWIRIRNLACRNTDTRPLKQKDSLKISI